MKRQVDPRPRLPFPPDIAQMTSAEVTTELRKLENEQHAAYWKFSRSTGPSLHDINNVTRLRRIEWLKRAAAMFFRRACEAA